MNEKEKQRMREKFHESITMVDDILGKAPNQEDRLLAPIATVLATLAAPEQNQQLALEALNNFSSVLSEALPDLTYTTRGMGFAALGRSFFVAAEAIIQRMPTQAETNQLPSSMEPELAAFCGLEAGSSSQVGGDSTPSSSNGWINGLTPTTASFTAAPTLFGAFNNGVTKEEEEDIEDQQMAGMGSDDYMTMVLHRQLFRGSSSGLIEQLGDTDEDDLTSNSSSRHDSTVVNRGPTENIEWQSHERSNGRVPHSTLYYRNMSAERKAVHNERCRRRKLRLKERTEELKRMLEAGVDESTLDEQSRKELQALKEKIQRRRFRKAKKTKADSGGVTE